MDKEGLLLLIRFALKRIATGYCGVGTPMATFQQALRDINADIPVHEGAPAYINVKKELEKFRILYPYLKTIASLTDRRPFDWEVIQAYIFGNSLLNKALPKDYNRLIQSFIEQGAQEEVVERMRKVKVNNLILTHTMQVVFMSPIQDAVVHPTKALNDCIVSWGKVLRISEGIATVNLNVINSKTNGSGYCLRQTKKDITINPEIDPEIKENCTIAMHWGAILKVLTPKEAHDITYWTRQVVDTQITKL